MLKANTMGMHSGAGGRHPISSTSITLVLFILLVSLAVSLMFAAYLVEGLPLPGMLYSLMDIQGETPPQERTAPPWVMPLPSSLPVQSMRDHAFEWYNIKPEARTWMAQLAVIRLEDCQCAGAYNSSNRSVLVYQSYLHVFLHEYAHANFHRKPLLDKMRFLFKLAKVYLDPDPRFEATRALMREELWIGAYYARRGMGYSPVWEVYAHLAELSGGDLSAIPEYLQPDYADYLQPGANSWTKYLKQVESNLEPNSEPWGIDRNRIP